MKLELATSKENNHKRSPFRLHRAPQFYYENTHPAIIDRETWNCVQLEFRRQAQYAKVHGIETYRTGNAQYPFSGRVIYKYCGRYYGYIRDETGSHMRCQSYIGNKGVQIPDLDRGKTNDSDHDRPMLCTDIKNSKRITSKAIRTRMEQAGRQKGLATENQY